ncbi:MAG: glycosyltransferase family 4 protein, partial [Gammaproteobacteria bacterium]|nr:glycosyltransferase family 4 protein [Gammaproteobacteria bacterium]
MNKKIKLMQITHDLAIGGLQQVVVNICRMIDKDKFDVTVLCLRDKGEFETEIEKLGIKVILVPQKENGADYFSFMKVAKIIKQENIEIIHTHNTQPFIDGTIGALISGVRTVIHTDHAREFPDKRRYMFAEWLMSHFAYKVVGVSEHTSRNLNKYERIAKNKIVTIPNGIEESIYDIDIDVMKKKHEIGILRDGPVIGLGVRLSRQKGITYLLQAMPSIIAKFPDVTLVIAGKGDYEERLRNEANDLGINENIIFIGARLDMQEILKVLDLYVLPSLFEGLPMVLLEAMASGCPIVATDVGGNSQAITHGENGSLVESENPEGLAKEVVKLLGDENL